MTKKRNPKGMGYFKENPNGTVTYQKCMGFLPSGGRRIFTVTASSKSECIKMMRKRELEWERSSKRSSFDRTITVIELCESHLKYQTDNGELTNKSWEDKSHGE